MQWLHCYQIIKYIVHVDIQNAPEETKILKK